VDSRLFLSRVVRGRINVRKDVCNVRDCEYVGLNRLNFN